MNWGYPWSLENILLKVSNNEVNIYSSLDHDIDRSTAEIQRPEDQPIFPIIFFSGQSTQPYDKSIKVRKPKWRSIEELDEAVHNRL